MKQFQIGKRYTTHHLKDPNKTLTMTVFFRTEQTIVIGTSLLDNSQRRLRYQASSDSECVNAPKGYAPFEAVNEAGKPMDEILCNLLDELDVTCSEEYCGSPLLNNYAIAERIVSKGWTLPTRCMECRFFMEYTEEHKQTAEGADGDCYLRKMNSDDAQFIARKDYDFCSDGKPKVNEI